MSDDEMQAALEWISGADTGLSSRCIWRTMMGLPEPGRTAHAASYPYDPDDFGRCYRLLRSVPSFRPRIGEMAVHGTAWARLAEHWDEIEAVFLRETGGRDSWWRAPETYQLMQRVIYSEKGAA